MKTPEEFIKWAEQLIAIYEECESSTKPTPFIQGGIHTLTKAILFMKGELND